MPNTIQSDFELVETNCPIVKVGIGVHHMVAIADFDRDDMYWKDGRTIVWGRNHKGQLGIGTRDQCNKPEKLSKLHSMSLRLTDVKCGLAFTLGLTHENRLVYFGDRMFCLDNEIEEDILEPEELDDRNGSIKKMEVCYNKILTQNMHGDVTEYGDYLNSEKNRSKKVLGGKVEFASDPNMKNIAVGPYHCCTISLNNELYSWGIDRMGSTGLPVKKEQLTTKKDRKIRMPRQVMYLSREFETNKEKNRHMEMAKNNMPDRKAVEEKKVKENLHEEEVDEKPVQQIEETDNQENEHEEEKKIEETKLLKIAKLKQVRKRKEKVGNNKDYAMKKNLDETQRHMNIIYHFLNESNLQSLSISKNDKSQLLHDFLQEEMQSK